MRQRITRALTIVAVAAFGLSWQTTRVGGQSGVTAGVTTCGTDMRVLVISADGAEADLPAIQQALEYVGTPYTTFIGTQQPGGVTAGLLSNGCHALYQGIILTTNVAVSAAEFQTLATYETAFGVRQVTWFTWPTPDFGFNWATDASATPVTLQPTTAGAQVFGYLNMSASATPIRTQFSWTYHATALDATTIPLLTDVDGNAMAAVHTYPDGHENLAMTFDSNPYLLHAMLLSYGVVNWVTRGLFIGDRHVYMSPQIDDVFIDDEQWLASTACGTSVDNTGVSQRSIGTDLNAVSAWQTNKQRDPMTANLRITMAFNGVGTTPGYSLVVGGTDQVVGGGTTGATADTLTAAAKALQGNFHWVSHTFDHENLDALTYALAAGEITQNNTVATQLGLTDYSNVFLVQPDVSGLSNPQFLQAAYDNGLRYLLSNTSVPGGANPAPNIGFWNAIQPGIFVIPRRANNLFFNVAKPDDWAAEYNCIYYTNPATKFFSTPQTYAQILDFISNEQLGYLLHGELDPWMFHQTNLAAYDGVHTLLTDLLDATLAKYSGYFTLPVLSPSIDTIGKLMANRTAARAAGISATIQPGVGIVVSSPTDVTIPITGLHLAGAEFYGGQWISWVPLSANVPVVLPMNSSQVQPATVKSTVFSDGLGTQVVSGFNISAGDVLVAFVASDGPVAPAQTFTVSGSGLPWTLVKRVNAQFGASEIWTATATNELLNAAVTSTPSSTGFEQSLTVVTFQGSGGVGASAVNNAAGGAPSVSLVTSKANSLVFGVGNDWDRTVPRTVGPNQAKVHEYLVTANGGASTLWVQNLINPVAAVNTTVLLNDTAPTSDRWNFASVEIVPAVLTVPGVVTTVPVPNVVTMTEAAAVGTLTDGGLVASIGHAPSQTVAAGLVSSQNPLGGASAPAGSTISLVVSTGPSIIPVVDTTVFSDGLGPRTATLSTSGPGTVLLAFVASDGPQSATQTSTVSGGGLAWTLVRRVNAQFGTSEIWTATATNQLLNASITSAQSSTGFEQSLTVVAFQGSGGVGASNIASAARGAPRVSLATTKANSLVFGVGNDWDRTVPRTVGPNQAKVHEYLVTANGGASTLWVQNLINPVAAVNTTVLLNDTAPTNDRWNFASVEITAK